jgi:putative FmdB family regulatory protein
MPTYEFACPDGHSFDKFFRTMNSAPSEMACPVCGKTAIRKVSGGAGLHFKGSGFYITDYGKDGKKGQKPAASSEGKGSESASAPNSDAKPAAPATPAPKPDASPAKKPSSE